MAKLKCFNVNASSGSASGIHMASSGFQPMFSFTDGCLEKVTGCLRKGQAMVGTRLCLRFCLKKAFLLVTFKNNLRKINFHFNSYFLSVFAIMVENGIFSKRWYCAEAGIRGEWRAVEGKANMLWGLFVNMSTFSVSFGLENPADFCYGRKTHVHKNQNKR